MSRGIGGGEGGGCEGGGGGGGKNINYRLLGYAPSNPHKYDPRISFRNQKECQKSDWFPLIPNSPWSVKQ